LEVVGLEEKEDMKKALLETRHRWTQENIDNEEATCVLVEAGMSPAEAVKQVLAWRKERIKTQLERRRTQEAGEKEEKPEEER
jgi:hypothetical protein